MTNQKELMGIIEGHALWLNGLGGERADLSGACLTGADLHGTVGNGREVKSLSISATYPITYTDTDLQIGRERHPITDWWGFDDHRIREMGGSRTLEFWTQWRDTIKGLIEVSTALPTGLSADSQKQLPPSPRNYNITP